ncbi:MAG: hypothetical protein SFV81_09685 [Pirellulaceae bacterium]|nr:hypothetical protein [Pirellulaceae bacterium]
MRSRTGFFHSFSTLLTVFARSQTLLGNAQHSSLRLMSMGLIVESRSKPTTRSLSTEVTNNYLSTCIDQVIDLKTFGL